MNLQEELQGLEAQAIIVWEFLTGKPSLASQLERLYLKVIVYLVSWFINARAAVAASAKPGIMAGSIQAYRDRVLGISPDIADAGFTNPVGNSIIIHLLAKTGNPTTALLNLVLTTMQADENRQLCDTITVQAATSQAYAINAALTLSISANEANIIAQATTALNSYIQEKQNTLGADIIRTDVINILRDIKEIRDVNLTLPATNIIIPPQSYATGGITLTVSGRV